MFRLTVDSKKLKYEIESKGKYSIIIGDSGSGKTNLCKLVRDRMAGDKTIKIESTNDVIALPPESIGAELQECINSIILIDENCRLLQEYDAGSIFRNSENYFVIITRKVMDYLPVCIENVYEMVTTGNIVRFCQV